MCCGSECPQLPKSMRKRFDRDHEGIFTMINTLHHQLAVSSRRSLHAAAIRSVRCSPRSGGCVSASRSVVMANTSPSQVWSRWGKPQATSLLGCAPWLGTPIMSSSRRGARPWSSSEPHRCYVACWSASSWKYASWVACARMCVTVAVWTAPPHPWFGQQRTAAEEAPLPQYFTVNDSIVNDCLVVLRELCYTYPALSEGVCGADSTSLWPRPAARHLGSPTVAGCVCGCVWQSLCPRCSSIFLAPTPLSVP